MYSSKRRMRLFRHPAFAGPSGPFVNPTLTLGSATTSVSQSPFVGGGSSYNFVSSANSYITVPASLDWALGTGDFTIEWFSYQITQAEQAQVMYTVGNSASTSARTTGGSFAYLANVGTRYTSFAAMTPEVWYHWAIVRQSGVTRVYRNGVLRGSSFVDTQNITNSTTALVIGNLNTFASTSAFMGYITNFRWVKGLAVYTGNFTVPTSELTATASANPYGGSNTAAIGAGFTKLLLVPTDGGSVPIFTYDTLALTSFGGSDAYIAKYTDAGRISWGANIGGSSTEAGYKVLVDGNENVYVIGTFFSPSITINNANGTTFGTISIGSGDSRSGFIVKYNTNGRVQWATRIIGNAVLEAGAIDSLGNIHIMGTYTRNPLTIFNADGSEFGTLECLGNDCCIVKYNTSGVAQWATSIGYTDIDEYGDISVDNTGNVFVTGKYSSYTVIYNSDTSQFADLTGEVEGNTFIVKYNSSGIGQWATQITAAAPDFLIRESSLDSSGNLLVLCKRTGGQVIQPIVYNADTTTFALSSFETTSIDAFIVKYNTSGTAQWILPLGLPSGTFDPVGLSTGISGTMYVREKYTSDPLTVYNADDSTFATLNLIGAGTGALVKYNSAGVGQWATRIGGTSANGDTPYTISADIVDNVYLGGIYYSNPLTIYNANGSIFGTLVAQSTVNQNGYIVKYNGSGTGLWAARMDGGTSTSPRSMSAKGTSLYVLGGYTSGTVTLRSVGF